MEFANLRENSELTHRKEYLQIKLGAGQGG